MTWQKVDKNAAALTGAEFQVYEGDVSGLSADELKAKTPLKFNGSNGAYSLPTANADGTYPEGATDTLQSNAEGKYTLNGLKLNTTYTVIETKVPTGYNGTFVGKFTITTGATADAAATFAGKDAWNLSKDNKGTFQVTNVKNITQLPLTGCRRNHAVLRDRSADRGCRGDRVRQVPFHQARSQRVSLTAAYN